MHRNMKGFIIQGGDPTGRRGTVFWNVGTGKGGDSITGEPIVDEFHPSIKVCVGQDDDD